MPDTEIDTVNKFLIGAQGDFIVFLRPLPQRLTQADALLVAAYLVALVGEDDQWQAVKSAVENA